MLIDWFTVGAQILNFLILIWLLKRFLYHPILDAIDAREQRIAAELADAASQKAEASEERETYQRKNVEFDKQRSALLRQATDAANAERQRLLDEARLAATALAARRQESLQSEAQALHEEIRRRTRQEVFAIARKALADLAGVSLEARMVEVFAQRLQDLNETEKQGLRAALLATGQPLIVRSTFDLPAAQRASSETAIKAVLGAAVAIRFETAPDLVAGIELSTDGHKLAWSISEYLAALEKGVGELLKVQTSKAGKTDER